MKLTKAMTEHYRCAYLYANGKLLVWHSQEHKKAGTAAWGPIHDTDIKCAFVGRLVLHRMGVMRLVAQSVHVKARECSIEGGSENTRRIGLAVGYIALQLGPNPFQDSVIFNLLDCLSADFTYQPTNVWSEPNYNHWGHMRVAA